MWESYARRRGHASMHLDALDHGDTIKTFTDTEELVPGVVTTTTFVSFGPIQRTYLGRDVTALTVKLRSLTGPGGPREFFEVTHSPIANFDLHALADAAERARRFVGDARCMNFGRSPTRPVPSRSATIGGASGVRPPAMNAPIDLRRYRFLGINDEQSVCSCCGKKGLKRVVWLLDLECDDVAHYGTTCAAFLLAGRMKDEPKPTMSAAEKIIEQARDAEVDRVARELLAEVLTLAVPEAIEGPNKWGVRCLNAGDASKPWVMHYGGRAFTPAEMLPLVTIEWRVNRVRERAELLPNIDVYRVTNRARAILEN